MIVAGVLATLAGSGGCRGSPGPEQRFAEAESLRLRYEKTASQQAIEKYRAAQAAWTRRGDVRDAARARQRVGETLGQLGLLPESLRAYREALALAEGSADRLLESDIRSDVGVAQAGVAERGESSRRPAGIVSPRSTSPAASTTVAPRRSALKCLGEAAYHSLRPDAPLVFYARPGGSGTGSATRGARPRRALPGLRELGPSRFDEAGPLRARPALWSSSAIDGKKPSPWSPRRD